MKKRLKNLSLILFITAIILISIGIVKAVSTVSLGTADNYAILAGSGITFTGAVNTNNVTGDIGSYPTETIVGIGNVVLNGTTTATSTTSLAKDALTQAYIDAASSTPATTITSDLGVFNGGTLLPGVYNSGSSIGLTGTLTLDGQGDPNAVFIFQAGSTLTTAASSTVKLINSAQACNVFWQVGSSATLGTYSTFKGNILAYASITDDGYSTIYGRFLAETAHVTLNYTTLVKATCEAPNTLYVIKNVVGGSAVPADFIISVTSDTFTASSTGTSTPGTAYSLLAGTYTVSEEANSSYTQTFSDDCPGGEVEMADADITCTITNTYITPTPDPTPSSGSSGPSPITPFIGISKTPNTLALSGPGSVTYNYKVWNVGGQRSLASVVVTDDKCGPLTLVSGDLNQNFKIEPAEIWEYTCTTTLYNTTTNTATATAKSDDPYQQTTTATAVATVVVSNLIAPVFTATTTPVIIAATSTVILLAPTSNPAIASTPKLPNAGVDSQAGNNLWNIIILAGVLFLAAMSLMIVLKKKKA